MRENTDWLACATAYTDDMYGRPDDRISLDRDAALPLYAQLADALLHDVRDLRPGDRFPSETEIRGRYDVSRATVRQAVADLEARGALRKVQGVGSFLTAPKIRHVPLLTSFSELAASQGFMPSHRLLSSSLEEASDESGLVTGTRCRFLRRLFFADGEPVGLAETWLPVDALNGRDDLVERIDGGSMYELLQSEAIGVVLDHAVETVSAGAADAATAESLGCERGTPVLLIRRLTFTSEGRVVESTRLTFVGDRYEYHVELRRPS